jgi:hypothetical protein
MPRGPRTMARAMIGSCARGRCRPSTLRPNATPMAYWGRGRAICRSHVIWSYFGFCQAVEEQSLVCDCYSVDTWRGDDQGGYYGEEVYLDVEAYNRRHYPSFSNLRRATFDEARGPFLKQSIDILHIDGHHSYESVLHDFENWFSAVRPGGIVLLHDVAARLPEFEVWRVWEELSRGYQTFTFPHSYGLGVLGKPGGDRPAEFLSSLFEAGGKQEEIARYYAACSEHLRLAFNASESGKAPRIGRMRCSSILHVNRAELPPGR